MGNMLVNRALAKRDLNVNENVDVKWKNIIECIKEMFLKNIYLIELFRIIMLLCRNEEKYCN